LAVNRDGTTNGHCYNIKNILLKKKVDGVSKIITEFWFADSKTGTIRSTDEITQKKFNNFYFNDFKSWEIWTYKPVTTSIFKKSKIM
jgi:hypothetical protein